MFRTEVEVTVDFGPVMFIWFVGLSVDLILGC